MTRPKFTEEFKIYTIRQITERGYLVLSRFRSAPSSNLSGLSFDNLAIISVVGDSMQPKPNDGALILVDRSQTKVIDGKSFVLRLGDDLLVKHVQRIPDNKVALISANKEYAPINIDLKTQSDTFQLIGRVVASMQNW